MNDVKQFDCAARLVCLQVTDKVPDGGIPSHLRNLHLRFLNPILTQVSHADSDCVS